MASLPSAVEKWGVAEVCWWLESIGLGAQREAFEREQIDGTALLQLSEDDAKELGISALGHRRKFQAAIAVLKQAPTPAAAAAEWLPKEEKQITGGVGARITAAEATTTLAHLGDLVQFIPPGFTAPSLPHALQDAGVPDATSVAGLCMDVARRAEANGALQGTTGLTAERVAFVPAYTFDFGPGEKSEHNPFRVLNSSLFERNALKLGRVRGLLFGLLSALRSLPRFSAPVLYRGIRARVNMDSAHYRAGNTITWHSFTSTTTDLAVTKSFITDAATGKCEGTLFIVKDAWGYDVQPLSFFNMEREILLEPEIDFKVASVLDGAMIVVELEMAPCPLLLESLIKPTHQPAPSPPQHAPPPPSHPAPSPQPPVPVCILDFESEQKKGLEGIRNIIAALKTHSEDADVCNRACVDLKNLAISNGENRVLIGREGGVPPIITALKTHAANADVCSSACGALRNLAINDENKVLIRREGGIPPIIAALKTHAANADVCKWACASLWITSANDENKVLIARSGGIEPIIAVLKTHATNADVCKEACGALRNLAWNNDENKVLIARSGGIEPIIAALKKHAANAEVFKEACGALRNLAVNGENKKVIKKALSSDPALKPFRPKIVPSFWD